VIFLTENCEVLTFGKQDLASVGHYIAKLNIASIEEVAKSFVENQNRDADDRARYM
jgi:hypothetical protein